MAGQTTPEHLPPVTTPAAEAEVECEPAEAGDRQKPMASDNTTPARKNLPKALSPSSISTFKQCPRKFYYSKIERITEPATAATARGRVIHAGLEHLFDLQPEERNLDNLYRLCVETWNEEKTKDDYAEVVGADDYNEEQFLAELRTVCERYFRLERPWRFNPDERELVVKGTLAGVPLFGIVDRFDRTPKHGRFISDYKTGSMPSERFQMEAFDQLKIYAALMAATRGETADNLRLVYVGNRPGVLTLAVTQEDLDRTVAQLVDIWNKIQAAWQEDNWPTRPARLCDWCWYQDFCPAFTTYEEAVEAASRKGVPVEILRREEHKKERAA